MLSRFAKSLAQLHFHRVNAYSPLFGCLADVDDWQDSSELELYVEQSSRTLLFISSRYFLSQNCLREVLAALDKNKPLTLVWEADRSHGGAPLEELRDKECPDYMCDLVFKNGKGEAREVIQWHRIFHCASRGFEPRTSALHCQLVVLTPCACFHVRTDQLVSLKAIATDALLASPRYRHLEDADRNNPAASKARSTPSSADMMGGECSSSNTDSPRRRCASLTKPTDFLFMPGELQLAELALPDDIKLFASESNPGAAEAANELQSCFPNLGIVVTPPSWFEDIRNNLRKGSRISHLRHGEGVVDSVHYQKVKKSRWASKLRLAADIVDSTTNTVAAGAHAVSAIALSATTHAVTSFAVASSPSTDASTGSAVASTDSAVASHMTTQFVGGGITQSEVRVQAEGQQSEIYEPTTGTLQSNPVGPASTTSSQQNSSKWTALRLSNIASKHHQRPQIHSVNVKFDNGESRSFEKSLLQLRMKVEEAHFCTDEPTHFLLYLSRDTFVGAPRNALAAQVRVAMAQGLPLVIAHENDEQKRGCEFSR